MDEPLLPDMFWVVIDTEWEVAARLRIDDRETWWRWGSKWPLKPGSIKTVGEQIPRPQREQG